MAHHFYSGLGTYSRRAGPVNFPVQTSLPLAAILTHLVFARYVAEDSIALRELCLAINEIGELGGQRQDVRG